VLIGQVIEAFNPQRYSLVSEILRRDDADFRLVVNKSIAQLYRSGAHVDIYYKWIGRIGISVPPVLATMYQLNALPE
jgi:ABC-type amino acid transport substrate-binding protein